MLFLTFVTTHFIVESQKITDVMVQICSLTVVSADDWHSHETKKVKKRKRLQYISNNRIEFNDNSVKILLAKLKSYIIHQKPEYE